jgi:hypothetical protein
MTTTPDFRALLANDAYAASFQSMGQYRTALLKALATPPPEPPTDEGLQKSEVHNEEFWRKHALEQLLHASTSYRLGVYSSEELKLYEKRARFFLDRWPQAKPPEPPTDDELSDLWTIYDGIVDLRDFVTVARAVLERWGNH